VFASVLLVGVLYVFLAYSTVVGFNDNAKHLSAASVPFITAAEGVASFLLFLAYMAGFTSICSSLISATNSQARIIFSSGREGLLPAVTARLTEKSKTPWVAFVVFLGIALGLTYIFGWNTNPVTFFGEIATLGTILIALTYLVANLALPVYFRRYHPERFSPLLHLVLPLLGAVGIVYARDRTLGERVGSVVADAD
jgi:amino acid transporter